MRHLLARVIQITLVGAISANLLAPTLADAAPRKKRPKPRPKPTTKPVEPDVAPAPTPDPPAADATKPAVAPPPAPVPQSPNPATGSAAADPTKPAKEATKDQATKDQAAGDKPANEPDVDGLRQEYLALRDELFRSRARASAVASQLYSTRMQIKLTYTSGRYYNPAKSTIRLDGASVYENATGAIAADDGIRFDGHVAPGRHVVTFRVEATGKDDDSFTSVTETQIVVKAVAGKDLVIAAKARDTGDIAYEWKRKEQGSYGLGIDVSVKTQARADGGKK
ncbi:MAG: hypothetical protein H0T89_24140 [Deltaproteobacteria bacterium]|nr:hypothetical protein [Deltaproteobacteria bacterium]